MALSTRILIGSAVAAVCGGALLFGNLELASAHRGGGRPPVLIERVACRHAAHHRGVPTSMPLGTGEDVTVFVPRTALIRVDAAGHVVAAATNTGCAPRPGDDFFTVRTDGSIKSAAKNDFVRQRWIGDFSEPGVYVAQTG